MFYSADFIKKKLLFWNNILQKYSTVAAICILTYLITSYRIVNFIRMLHGEAMICMSSFTEQTTAIIQYSVKGRICRTLHQRI